jgi:hypothetical protein
VRYEITTTIAIEAPPERVWSVLLAFERYPEWNPFVRSIEGQASEGSAINVIVQSHTRKPMAFRPVILRNNANRELRWKGKLVFPGIFDGEHYFFLAPTGVGSTEFTHGERFTGLLVPLLRGGLERDTQAGFEAMNRALKERVEQGGA